MQEYLLRIKNSTGGDYFHIDEKKEYFEKILNNEFPDIDKKDFEIRELGKEIKLDEIDGIPEKQKILWDIKLKIIDLFMKEKKININNLNELEKLDNLYNAIMEIINSKGD